VTEQEWNDLKDRELDEALTSLFSSVEKPKPGVRFAARTMTAVRAAELPAGRIRLRHPLLVPVAWIAIIALVSVAVYRIAPAQPVVASLMGSLVAFGIRAGFWLFHATREALAFSGPLAAISRALSSVIVTTEGSLALLVIAATGAISLSMLHKLLAAPAGSRPNLQS